MAGFKAGRRRDGSPAELRINQEDELALVGRHGLSALELRVFLAIRFMSNAFAGELGKPHQAAVKDIAEAVRGDERHVRRALRALVERDMIRAEPGGGRGKPSSYAARPAAEWAPLKGGELARVSAPTKGGESAPLSPAERGASSAPKGGRVRPERGASSPLKGGELARVSRPLNKHSSSTLQATRAERPDVVEYIECWIGHFGLLTEKENEFFRVVPYAFDRLNPAQVVAEIDRLAVRWEGRRRPHARYLEGRLGDLQTAASDANVRPSAQSNGTNLQRIRSLLPPLEPDKDPDDE